MNPNKEKYEPVIGLEVHAQLLSKTKMFCGCPNLFGAAPNTLICPVCSGQPGSLPVINRQAITLGIRAAIALNAQIQGRSVFARKNYFYPDLPKGYQISQYEAPFSKHGFLDITLKDGSTKRIGITRIHFEEDAGKSLHSDTGTLIDLDRAGVPLIEIVSEPDIRTTEQAGQYLRTLRSILRFADICDGNMEEGSFRCDANVSLRRWGETKFGTKIELKNLNSFKFVEKALEYEMARQAEMLDNGEPLTQQTRLWNDQAGITELMREKEDADDYRYFTEPDLPALIISDNWVAEVKDKMPELPAVKSERFKRDYNLSDYDANVLTSTKELASFFEEVTSQTRAPKTSANWVMNELLGRLNAAQKEISDSPVTARQLSALIQKIESNEISGKIAKDVFEEMFQTGKDCADIIREKGLVQISDPTQLEAAIKKVIASNPQQLSEYKQGKVKLLGFFVGQAMKETKGQANPALLNELVKKLLG